MWVLYLNLKGEDGKTSPAFRCYSVRVSAAELAAVRSQVGATSVALLTALDSADPDAFRALPLCREWKCGARNCEWYDQCTPEGRWGDPKFDALTRTRGKKTK